VADVRMLAFCTFDHPISVCRDLLHLRLHSLLPFSFISQKFCGQGYCRCDYFCDLALNTAVGDFLYDKVLCKIVK